MTLRSVGGVALFVAGLLSVGAIGDGEDWFHDQVVLAQVAYLVALAAIWTLWSLLRDRRSRR
jgi:hypothetical protein